MIMNEHIQKLISAYLHRGSTPAQEKELFEACKRDPQTAELLRQHLILSLKLRQLRDDVNVAPSLHAAVTQRIAALDRTPAPTVLPVPRRFRLAHLFGTGIATAAAAAALALLLWPDSGIEMPADSRMVANVADTVYIVKKDTVTQLRDVVRNVYIAEAAPRSSQEGRTAKPEDGSAADSDVLREPSNAISRIPVHDIPAVPASEHLTDASAPVRDSANEDAGEAMIADARPVETLSPREQARNYLEQYNSMLVTVASVRITNEDRITN
jgi:hypothetical protein